MIPMPKCAWYYSSSQKESQQNKINNYKVYSNAQVCFKINHEIRKRVEIKDIKYYESIPKDAFVVDIGMERFDSSSNSGH